MAPEVPGGDPLFSVDYEIDDCIWILDIIIMIRWKFKACSPSWRIEKRCLGIR